MSAPTPGHDMPAMPTPSISPFVPLPGGRRDPTPEPTFWRRIPLGPSEGWLTILLIPFLVLPVAWSITDARWVLGRGELTAFLPWVTVGGAAWGILAAKVGWGRWRTHVLGAVYAALIIPIFTGTVVDPAAGSIGGYFTATANSTVEAVLDLTIRNRTVTQEFGHYLLVLGIICWATGQ
ncbi:MAG TPA: hypothetical protein VK656_05480, partial [Candidatus Acidoferrum sp.]|nr:hypothetical protein [Candidatus Acidoferrum sp.]